jgi:UPF0755 protein
MWKHIASNALTILILGLIAVVGAIAWGQQQYVADGPLDTAICVRVEPGSTMRRVSRDLEAQGAVSSGSIFRIGAEYSDKARQLKAGSFLVPEGASMAEIVDLVTRGGMSTCGTEVVYRIGVTGQDIQIRDLDPESRRFVTEAEFDPAAGPVPDRYAEVREESDTRYRVTLAEGVTSWQVVEALKAADFLTGEVDAVPAEGALAPDSYEVRAGSDRATLLADMVTRQAVRVAEVWANRAEDLPFGSPEEMVILASIIEKETSIGEERPLVSSVLVNRLNQGWRLQFDPTIIYGITRGEGTLGRPISRGDRSGATEQRIHGEITYNTYQIDGLPAGPIGNPGLASMEAAVNPAETEFMFFVADGTGGHAFSVTLNEHNANVDRLRAIEAERASDN